MESAVPSKQLGDFNEFENVEEILPKEESCYEQCDEVSQYGTIIYNAEYIVCTHIHSL